MVRPSMSNWLCAGSLQSSNLRLKSYKYCLNTQIEIRVCHSKLTCAYIIYIYTYCKYLYRYIITYIYIYTLTYVTRYSYIYIPYQHQPLSLFLHLLPSPGFVDPKDSSLAWAVAVSSMEGQCPGKRIAEMDELMNPGVVLGGLVMRKFWNLQWTQEHWHDCWVDMNETSWVHILCYEHLDNTTNWLDGLIGAGNYCLICRVSASSACSASQFTWLEKVILLHRLFSWQGVGSFKK